MARQDQAWKNAIQALFPHALEFFLPSLEAHRDRTRPFEFLEQELRAVSRGVRRGGVVDALVKVPLPEGEDSWLLLHVEIQGRAASGEIPFPERMFSYAARIWDRYHRRITALAVLTEPDGTRVPDRFVLEAYGTELAYRYNLRALAQEDEEALLGVAAEAGADDLQGDDEGFDVYCDPSSLSEVGIALKGAGYPVESMEISMVPKNTVSITRKDEASKLLTMVERFEEHDDVQNVYANFDIPDEILEELGD